MKMINDVISPKYLPIRIVQFGEGVFLRGFVDLMFDIANKSNAMDAGIAIVKPRQSGNLEVFRKQNNIYSVLLRGKEKGQEVQKTYTVTSLQIVLNPYEEYEKYASMAKLDTLQFVVSNTTEAGIVFDPDDMFDLCPPKSFPGKLTKFLYERFNYFNGAPNTGLIILPVELIDNNGSKLLEYVRHYIQQWNLKDDFRVWVEESCLFCNTLVDRIITGFPYGEEETIAQQFGFYDRLLVVGEPFASWVIENKKDLSVLFPLKSVGLPVQFTNNIAPYRERKIRILNGAHTSTVLAAFLAGKNTVYEIMKDSCTYTFLYHILFDEIMPYVPLPEKEVREFTEATIERFSNPFIKHMLLSISLNSVSKWRSRILPTFRDYYKDKGCIPRLLTFSFAALMLFYASAKNQSDQIVGIRDGQTYRISDDLGVLSQFVEWHTDLPDRSIIQKFAANTTYWGEDLTHYEGFVDMVAADIKRVGEIGMRAMLMELIEECS